MSGPTRVYIGKLNPRVTEREIERFFRDYGRVRDITFKGTFAFVEFEDARDAEEAVREMNGRELCGDRVYVEFANSPRGSRFPMPQFAYPAPAFAGRRPGFAPPRNTQWRLVIKNLSLKANWMDVKDFMRTAAEVCYSEAHKRRNGEGVCDFETRAEMKRALDKLQGKELKGDRIELVEDMSVRRDSRSRSRSRERNRGGRSRARSRPRARSRARSRSDSRGRRGRSRRSRSSTRSRSPLEKKRAGSKTAAANGAARASKDKRAAADVKSRSRSRSAGSRSSRSSASHSPAKAEAGTK